MYWLINDDPDSRYDDITDLLEFLVPDDMYSNDTESFDEYIDNREDSVNILGYSFTPSDILSTMDHDAYMEEFNSWQEEEIESRREDAKYTIGNLIANDWEWVEGYRVYAYEEEEDEDHYNCLAESCAQPNEPSFDSYDRLQTVALELAIEQQEIQDYNKATGEDFMRLLQTF